MKFTVRVRIKEANGFQVFRVEAEDTIAARIAFRRGGGEHIDDEIEVTELDTDDIEIELEEEDKL